MATKKRLWKIIFGFSPINTKDKIDSLITIFESRGVTVTWDIYNLVSRNTSDNLLNYFKEKITAYQKKHGEKLLFEHNSSKYIPQYSKKRKKLTTYNSLHPEISRQKHYQRVAPDSLAAKGYDYGLSDW